MNFSDKFGINSRQLKTLLVVYLKQDFRSGKSFLQTGAKDYAASNKTLLAMLGMYVFVGLSTSLFAFARADIFIYSLVATSVTLFIVALAVVSESGNVIFNEAEPDVIGHLPINSRTLFAAKVLNIFLFTLLLATAANILPTFAGVFVKDSNVFFILAHIISAILAALFATMLVVTSYGLLMRFVDKERFNNLVAYAQTGIAMFLILGYQLLPRLVDKYQLEINGASRKYFLLYPPAWFSGITLLIMGKGDWLAVALASLALISLAILSFIAWRKLAAGYVAFAAQLAYDSTAAVNKNKKTESLAAKTVGRNQASVIEKFEAFFLRKPVERAVFDLVKTYLKRDREIKVRLYPSFSYLIMFPLIGLFSGGLPDPFLNQRFLFNSLIGAAMIPFVASVAVGVLLFSEHYQAAYIFRAAPVQSLGDIHGGLRKAAFCFVAIPGALLLLVLYTILWRDVFHALFLIAPWLALTPAMMMVSFIRRELLPLSRKYKKGEQSARSTITIFGTFFCLAIVGTVQNFSLQGRFPYWLFFTGILAFSALSYFLLHKISGESRPLPTETTPNE